MPQAVTIRSLPRAFEFVKAMHGEGVEWGEGYRGLGRDAIAAILQGQMAQAVNEHLDRMALLDEADRCNGFYRRHLLTELGEIELAVPRTRRFAPIGVVRAYARRPEQLDRMILACFVLGLSVRKVSQALLPILGRPIIESNVIVGNAPMQWPNQLGMTIDATIQIKPIRSKMNWITRSKGYFGERSHQMGE
jgi:hypothetical protein